MAWTSALRSEEFEAVVQGKVDHVRTLRVDAQRYDSKTKRKKAKSPSVPPPASSVSIAAILAVRTIGNTRLSHRIWWL
jgi:hypothetical protein